MSDLPELVQRCPAHPLGRRISALQLGIGLLKFTQARHTPVILGIRHGGVVQHIVLVVPVIKAQAQGLGFLG